MAQKTKIINGLAFQADGSFAANTVYLSHNRILSECEYNALAAEECTFDACGAYVIPGLTDIHFHGCMELTAATVRRKPFGQSPNTSCAMALPPSHPLP